MYKLAFIGGSINSIAGYPHFIASQMDKRFEVIAGAFSTDEKTNNFTAKTWNIPKIYNSWEELIKHEIFNIDVVTILTPTPMHCDIIIKLLENNIPIICEKPLVGSIEDINKIKDVYDPSKHFLIVTNNYSGYPMVRELQEKIKNKELGNILNIKLQMPQESFLRPPKSVKYPQKWRLKDDFIPMICLDLGAHLHHLSFFLLQEEPNNILASYNKLSNYKIVDDANMLLEYKSGIKGTMWISKTALGNRNGLHIEIYGDKASALWHQENSEKLELSYSSGQKVIMDRGGDLDMINNPLYNRMTPGHPSGFIESFANLYNDIANALDKFKNKEKYTNKYVYGFNHAKNGIDLLHTASISNEKKEWVTVNQNR